MPKKIRHTHAFPIPLLLKIHLEDTQKKDTSMVSLITISFVIANL